ncbi:hypothetical protein BV898_03028 [Hypsibius exemplaris]|uniref:Uncharacterized protein n=1 Tax=Hypsibius exemplaris TaxID=2072580 RepID=A0A1W0X5V4_HYPEX|nr:hypothetical protein BV898_03028 [Hypsibius exemplaris]
MDWISICIAAATAGLALLLWLKPSRPKNSPPGPPAIPIFGSFHFFAKQPHIAILKAKEKYGDTYMIHVGRRPVVILSNYNTVKKVFGDDLVSGRDNESYIRYDASTLAESGLIFSEGDLWKTHRRFALSTLRDLAQIAHVVLWQTISA